MGEKEVSEIVDEAKGEIISFCRELIKTESYNPPGGEEKVVQVIAKKLEEEEVRYEIISSGNKRTNILAGIKKGNGRKLLFCGHMDTVPPGELETWKFHPLSAAVEDGKIYGRGACDMKSGLASMVMAAILCKRHEECMNKINGEVILAIVADEEMGSDYGMKFLVNNYREKLGADYAVVCEPSGSSTTGKAIVIGEKGDYELKVTFFGKKGHSSVPYLADNAVEKACRFIANLNKMKIRRVKPPITKLQYLKMFVEKYGWGEILKGLFSKQKSAGTAVLKALVSCVYSTTIINGGFKSNVIPDKCEATIDFRVLPGQTVQDVEEAVENLAAKLGIKVSVEVPLVIEPSVLTDGEELTGTLEKLVNKFYGEKPLKIMMPGASDARFLRNILKIPTVQFGPGEGETAHASNEYVEINDLIKATKVYMSLIEEIFK